MEHETTWQDIALGYRQVIERILPVFINSFGKESVATTVIAVTAIDIEAELLTKKSDVEVTLEELRPGALFVTRDHVYAVKSEYAYGNGKQCQCILLASGEYAHFPDGNQTLVCEVHL